MPKGVTHEALDASVLGAGALLASLANLASGGRLLDAVGLELVAAFAGGFLAGSLLLSPDLDMAASQSVAALRRWGVHDVGVTRKDMLRVRPVQLTDSQEIRLQRIDRRATFERAAGTVEVPLPEAAQGELVAWVAATLRTLFAPPKKSR